ncbi:glycoside hydrolase family 18 protein [Colletotrichum scovillei]|uniref:chitinase n=1 Tax=Colletotrichum scovillei TaxID=1209932 RepID=A0A9P7RDP8_9PEZI|nr:glycoside hydrolase family 18 protein [Colletotrichum scovillei]KAG7081140.1 glycoside hydrolase family 18 protein [Colletotrichum scovillei]
MFPLTLLYAFMAAIPFLISAVPLDSNNHVAPITPYSIPSLDHLLTGRALPTGTCNADTPCENAACCGSNGLCGYSPTECGKGNCTSNCDAKAQCGQYGKEGSQECPLSVCCSEFGFCGSTSDFCGKGCQKDFGGCGNVTRPSCSGNSVSKRTIGYYEGWSNTRSCQAVSPEDLNLNGFSHINFAFAFFDPRTFQIAPMDTETGKLYSRFTALKKNNAGLEAWISVGGWSFTDPGATRTAFSDMTSTSGNRQRFISGLIDFMEHYGFDGVDLDWEYPQADDRGGVTADKKNYALLTKELRAAFGSRYGISMTLPTSYWYLQHFDLASIAADVDWFNFMAYDLHGTWDAASKFVGPYLAPHTNVTEIDMGLDLLWRAGVKPAKVILGLGWYGRSFTLSDPSCNKPNGVCQFSGGALAGQCSNASGILTLQEINGVIDYNGVKPVWDKDAMVKWITWDDNQWVSYDDDDTFEQKRKFANSRCLGGTMVWAMDQRDQGEDNGLAPASGVTTGQQEDAQEMAQGLAAGVSCYTTDCGASCKKGTNPVTQMNGQPGMLSTSDRCDKNKYRTLCCDDGTTMGTCKWRGYRGLGLSCMGGCDDEETEVLQDTNNHSKNGDQTCTGGIQSYCCKGFESAPTKEELEEEAKEKAEELAEEAAEQAALDIAAKAFCRLAIPALLAPLELIEAAIPIIGEILDIAEIAATPALIQLCTDGIEKEGKAVFKVFGKEHSVSFNKPSKTVSRPPKSTHSPAKTSSCPSNAKRADDGRPCKRQKRYMTSHRTSEIVVSTSKLAGNGYKIPCNGNGGVYPEACKNYKSIVDNYPQYKTITCPYRKIDDKKRPITGVFNQQRSTALWDPVIAAPNGCSPDEYPPAVMAPVNDGYSLLTSMIKDSDTEVRRLLSAKPPSVDGQMVRYLDLVDNREAGKIFDKCRQPPVASDMHSTTTVINPDARVPIEWHLTKVALSRLVWELDFDGLPDDSDDYGVADNICVPTINGVKHPGYALLNEDEYFDTHAAEAALRATWPNGPAQKRWVEPAGLVVEGVNSTRVATPEELRDHLGFDECTDSSCSREIEKLKDVARTFRDKAERAANSPAEAPAPEATPVHEHSVVQAVPPSQPGRSFDSDIPMYTGI